MPVRLRGERAEGQSFDQLGAATKTVPKIAKRFDGRLVDG